MTQTAPDAAARVATFLDAFEDPAHPQGAISTLRTEGLRLTVADLRAVLAEVQRLTDELDCAGWSSDRGWSREIDLTAERDEARKITRTLTLHIGIVATRALLRAKLEIDPLPEWFYGPYGVDGTR